MQKFTQMTQRWKEVIKQNRGLIHEDVGPYCDLRAMLLGMFSNGLGRKEWWKVWEWNEGLFLHSPSHVAEHTHSICVVWAPFICWTARPSVTHHESPAEIVLCLWKLTWFCLRLRGLDVWLSGNVGNVTITKKAHYSVTPPLVFLWIAISGLVLGQKHSLASVVVKKKKNIRNSNLMAS